MTQPVETHRSFVNTWETDENAHMNVQFYFKRFDEAARLFGLSQGGRHDGPLPRDRHVRYHAELLSGALTAIRSAVLADGPLAGRVVHLLENVEGGKLAATALDWPGTVRPDIAVSEADLAAALPRSLDAEPFEPLSPQHVLDHGGLVSHRSIAAPAECALDGTMSQQTYVSRFSDAAAHAWASAGVDAEWLRRHDLGRMAVEMKVTHHAPGRAGDPLALYSYPSGVGGKTVTLHHELVRLSDGAALASCAVVALIVDLKTRRATGLPDSVAERMRARLSD